MSTPDFILKLQESTLADLIRGDPAGSGWLFPIVETFHVFSLAIVFGSIVMVDLRLLGISSQGSPVSKLLEEVRPWTWMAFIAAVVTGTLLFVSKAGTYWNNFEARGKFICMMLAGVNMMVFHFGIHRRIATWDSARYTPVAAQVAGALSLLLWFGVIVFGRWIGFST